MGLLDKISDKINEKIDETLNPKSQVQHSKTAAEMLEERSAENCAKHHDEITSLFQHLDEILGRDDYDDQLKDLGDCCSEILDLDPYNFEANRGMITALIDLEEYDQAYATCSRLLRCYPNDLELQLLMGDIFLFTQKYGDAISYYDGIIQQTTTENVALRAKRAKSRLLFSIGNYEEAVQFCDGQLLLHESDETLLSIKKQSLEKIQEQKDQQEKSENTQRQIDELSRRVGDVSEMPKSNPEFSVADEISKLINLKEQGAITEEEFLEMKQKLMGKM